MTPAGSSGPREAELLLTKPGPPLESIKIEQRFPAVYQTFGDKTTVAVTRYKYYATKV